MRSEGVAFTESADVEEVISASNCKALSVVVDVGSLTGIIIAVRVFIVACDILQCVAVIGFPMETD